ncbi:acyltransferase [Kineosporia sp. R_H_3]|uniref:acyltransferase family protein n=1 Tax=Kineosporia sp. R_H_3 TaxID=1961848 RepID=UPI000B4AD6F6|nr:acyltransferase [Kineosporia sp. R_H_3]
MARVRALDGLRAVAVMLVFLKHLQLPAFRGGWVGVDIFFVLSGFLITSMLLGEHERTGRIDLKSFWVRRLARLYPALIAMVVLGLAVAPERFAGHPGVAWSAVIALTYTQDLTRFWTPYAGGFDHTWSLAVEEQFYLLWPLAVLLCRGRRAAIGVLAAGVAVAGAGSLYLYGGFVPPARNVAYFFLHTRGWEIVVGCLLAVVLSKVRMPALLGSALLWLALPATAAVVLLCGRPTTPLWVAVGVAVALSVVVVASLVSAPRATVGRVLSLAPLVWLGRVSYGVYLYHWVLIRLVYRHLTPYDGLPYATALKQGTVVAITLAVAGLSYHLLERPIQDVVRRHLERTAAGLPRGRRMRHAAGAPADLTIDLREPSLLVPAGGPDVWDWPAAAVPRAAEPFGADPFAADPFAADPFVAPSFAAAPFSAEPLNAEPLAAEPVVVQRVSIDELFGESAAVGPTGRHTGERPSGAHVRSGPAPDGPVSAEPVSQHAWMGPDGLVIPMPGRDALHPSGSL